MGRTIKTNAAQSAFMAYQQSKENSQSSSASTKHESCDKELELKTQTQSNSLIKQISNQAALRLRGSRSKMLKKRKNGNVKHVKVNGTVNEKNVEFWRPPDGSENTSTPLFATKTSDKPFIFGVAKGALRASKRTKKRDPYNFPKVYENSQPEVVPVVQKENKKNNSAAPVGIYKEVIPDIRKEDKENHTTAPVSIYKEGTDHSIEMSTSQSLTGFESEESLDQSQSSSKSKMTKRSVDTNANEIPKKKSLEISVDIAASPPPSKRAKPSNSFENLDVEDGQDHSFGKDSVKSNTSQNFSSSSGLGEIMEKASRIFRTSVPVENSEKNGEVLLKWLIHPMPIEKFLGTMWEKKPFLIRRNTSDYAHGLFGSCELNHIMKTQNIRYGVNLDVTSYSDGQRQTHNPEGRVFPSVAWDYYKNGCSLRFLNPQAYSRSVWELCAALQEYFKTVVGANVYLTPPGTQGFAPHYDDIEAFIMQLEGRKHWRLYQSRPGHETLPRYSSGNFKEDEIGDVIFEATLEPGDLLYFPRGVIHQGKSLPDTHSLHITISTYQRNTWGDVIEQLVPAAVQHAINQDIEFRRGLPFDYLSCFGYQNRYNPQRASRRKELFEKISSLFASLADFADLDGEADNRASDFLFDSLPPALSANEERRTVFGTNVSMLQAGVPGTSQISIEADTQVRLLRRNIVRIVIETSDDNEDSLLVHHSTQNSRIYHSEERKTFEVTEECCVVIKHLLNEYPEYTAVKNFPTGANEYKINIACALFEKGILMTQDPIAMVSEDDVEDGQ